MRKVQAIDALFPRGRQAILAALFVRPEKAWFASELARKMGVPPSSLQRELSQLTAAGILTTTWLGRMTFFRANSRSPLFGDLRGLILKTVGLVDVIGDALRPLGGKNKIGVCLRFDRGRPRTER